MPSQSTKSDKYSILNNEQGQGVKVIAYFSIVILIIHTINTIVIYFTISDPCMECMYVVYGLTGIPVLFYLLGFNYTAKSIFCLALPISLYFFNFYIGVLDGFEIVYLTFLFMTFYLFNHLTERVIIALIYYLCYLGMTKNINVFNIPNSGMVAPENGIVGDFTFTGCFIIIFIFCQYFFSTLKSYKKSTGELLNDLKIKNKKLETANSELERFNYIASHDLKSPLRNISSFINLIERDINRNKFENLKEYLFFIKTGSDNMFQLIEDILKYSKIKDVSERKKEVINLNDLVNELNNSFNNQIVSNKLPSIYESMLLVKVIFQNLIENGLKYNDSEQPTVTVSYLDKNSVFQITFKDNGIGMEDRYLEQIFEMFKRLHAKSEYEGTGIGLALVKRITEQLDGKITVSSTPGKGTEFSLTLPKKIVVVEKEDEYSTTFDAISS